MKPNSMSLKDWLVSEVAKEREMDEALCDKIISWSYAQAKEATKTARSIELSGFGKLLISERKLTSRIKNKEENLKIREASIELGDAEKNKQSIESLKEKIKQLKTKLPDAKPITNTRGLEEQPVSASKAERAD